MAQLVRVLRAPFRILWRATLCRGRTNRRCLALLYKPAAAPRAPPIGGPRSVVAAFVVPDRTASDGNIPDATAARPSSNTAWLRPELALVPHGGTCARFGRRFSGDLEGHALSWPHLSFLIAGLATETFRTRRSASLHLVAAAGRVRYSRQCFGRTPFARTQIGCGKNFSLWA